MDSNGSAHVEKKIHKFSPREFLKSRRPERFSDSTVSEQPALDRSILEYHLSTLTSRSQEVQFATFARHLLEREICPNLLPQTGPTGGGDSKVDSETYPVADAIALGWHTAIGTEAASERWGFAFSAKKQWRPKVESDIQKAAETNRGYKKVFFVTNQFIRDKARAEVEDKLSREHALDVRIIDRSWILEKVFANGHENLAIEDLQLQTSTRRTVRRGPRDTQRETELEGLERRIQERLRKEHPTAQVAEDCIEAADRARQLERPRTEVEGLYERAERVATRYGSEHQRFICAYQRAWTSYWWYEDYKQFSEFYKVAEQRAKGTENAYVLELQTNLWSLLHNAVLGGNLDERSSGHADRTRLLSKELDRLSRKDEQMSTALHAHALKLQMSLLLGIRAKDTIGQVLTEFQDVLRKCEGLAGFPFEPLANMLTELGEALGHLPAYDQLFKTIVEIQTERKKDCSAAHLLVKRGIQQLRADQPYDAIRSLGLSLSRLYKHESREDAIEALYLCGCAYEQVGLLWAARGTLLSAASLATSEFYTYGNLTLEQAACYRTLKWVELQLGRVAQTLCWHEVDLTVRHVLADKGLLKIDYAWEALFDGTLGMLLLKTNPWELRYTTKLPQSLESLGLFNSWAAALYALGYEQELREAQFPSNNPDEDLHSYFLQWRDHPSAEELPAEPSFYEGSRVTLVSRILGCTVTIETDNASPTLELSESILAALESLLSTGTTEWLATREPLLTMSVRRQEMAKSPFEFELDDSTGRPHFEIACPYFDAHFVPRSLQQDYKEKLFELLALVVARIVVAQDLKATLAKLFRDELAIERSLNFTGSFVTTANVLGTKAKARVSAWTQPDTKEFDTKRTERWDDGDVRRPASVRPKPLKIGQGEAPVEMSDPSKTRQKEIQTVSLIREPLWGRAGWSGTAFVTAAEGDDPPVLALGFKERKAAAEIFKHWEKELGSADSRGLLRLTVIRGINETEPYWYRVVIGSNPEVAFSSRQIRHAIFVSRACTMTPSNDVNLNRFLAAYNLSKKFYLAPAMITDAGFGLVESPWLLKDELILRDAWEIGMNDLDSHAIYADDVPIIPAGKANPPVAQLLQRKRRKGSESDS
jgi:hypothetical protein